MNALTGEIDKAVATAAALPPVRSEPLLAAYERFKHLDTLFEMIRDPDGTEDSDPFHAATRDLWRAIKASLGHIANTTNQAEADSR